MENKQSVETPEFRASYPHLFKPQSINGSDPTYSITMLFDKRHDLSVLKLAMKHAKIAKYGPNKENWPTDLQSPVMDGDSPKLKDKEGYAGHWAIKASKKEIWGHPKISRPEDPTKFITDPSEFKAGDYARAIVYASCWEYMGKCGVRFNLDGVQKTRSGNSLSGRKEASERFSPITSAVSDDDTVSDDDSF